MTLVYCKFCNHHHCLTAEHFHQPQKEIHFHWQQLLATTHHLSVSFSILILHVKGKVVSIPLQLSFFHLVQCLEIHLSHSTNEYLLFFMAKNQSHTWMQLISTLFISGWTLCLVHLEHSLAGVVFATDVCVHPPSVSWGRPWSLSSQVRPGAKGKQGQFSPSRSWQRQ